MAAEALRIRTVPFEGLALRQAFLAGHGNGAQVHVDGGSYQALQ